MKDKIYAASFKSVFTGNKVMFYEVEKDLTRKHEDGKIVILE